MASKIAGLTIAINGETTGLDKALSGVNKKSRDLQSELREVERLLKLDPGNTELLAQKQKLLTDAVAGTKEKLETLKVAVQQAQEQLEKGEISEEQFRALQREVIKTEQNLQGLTDKQRIANGVMTDAEKALDAAEKAAAEKAAADEAAAKKTAELAEATELADKKLELEKATLEKNTASMDENKNSAEILKTTRESLGRQIDIQKEKISALEAELDDLTSAEQRNESAIIEKKTELARAKTELDNYGKALKDLGTDLEHAGNKMKDLGKEMSNIGKDLSMKVTAPIVAAGGAAFKMAADMEDAVGATDQIYKKSAGAVKDWADQLESYYGIAESEAIEYANMMGTMLVNIGGLTEEEAAKQSATLIELAGDLAAMYGGSTADAVRALTGALKGNNTMLDNYGMAANDALIKTKALEMGLYSGTGQMDLAAKQAATLALIMEQSGAAQGQAAREAEGSSGAMRAFATEMKNLSIAIGENLLPVITPLISKLTDLLGRFSDMNPAVQKVLTIIALLVAAIGPLLVAAGMMISAIGNIAVGISKLGPLVKGLSSAVGVLSKAMAFLAANPIVLVIAAVAALVAALVHLWKTNEDFRNAIINAWNKIVEVITSVVEKIKTFFTKTIPNATKSMVECFKELPGKIKQVGIDLIIGLWNGIKKKLGWLKNKVTGVVDTIKGWFTGSKGFDVHSPSKWGENLGENVSAGIAKGLIDSMAAISQATNRVVSQAQSGLTNMATPQRPVRSVSNGTPALQPVNITLQIDGKILARHLYDPLKTEEMIRGAVLSR
jgi:phage-related minor tail protein